MMSTEAAAGSVAPVKKLLSLVLSFSLDASPPPLPDDCCRTWILGPDGADPGRLLPAAVRRGRRCTGSCRVVSPRPRAGHARRVPRLRSCEPAVAPQRDSSAVRGEGLSLGLAGKPRRRRRDRPAPPGHRGLVVRREGVL